ncbi:hypothetical protein JOQ06_000932 [Pogonophryne albipinna]|uniref:Uncharacterized protein n=1 Tax=Pogonophryne albipinna TaxID=1090488 RepID=A0AAD6B615_9TELE|nr:hypothetical protein JOQ06_000932 [Pogonophryne albipinna]
MFEAVVPRVCEDELPTGKVECGRALWSRGLTRASPLPIRAAYGLDADMAAVDCSSSFPEGSVSTSPANPSDTASRSCAVLGRWMT